jgi:hypothetical protein
MKFNLEKVNPLNGKNIKDLKKGKTIVIITAAAVLTVSIVLGTIIFTSGNKNNPEITPSSSTISMTTSDPISSSIPSEIPKEVIIDITNDAEVSSLANKLKYEIMLDSTRYNVSSDTLKDIIYLANNKDVPLGEQRTLAALLIQSISTIDIPYVENYVMYETKKGEKTSVSIEEIFTNKDDRSFIKTYWDKREAIADAVKKGETADNVINMMIKMYEETSGSILDGKAYTTANGDLKFDSLGTVAKLIIVEDLRYRFNDTMVQYLKNKDYFFNNKGYYLSNKIDILLKKIIKDVSLTVESNTSSSSEILKSEEDTVKSK